MHNILIPPSIPLIIYAIIVEGNIVQLFQAAAIPGILATVVVLKPDVGPAGARADWKERWSTLRGVWCVAAIFGVVYGVASIPAPSRPRRVRALRARFWSRFFTAGCVGRESSTP